MKRGLYEVLITEAIESRLRDLDGRLRARRDSLGAAEAADRIALHLGRVVRRTVSGFDDSDRVAMSVRLARRVLEEIDNLILGAETAPDAPIDPGMMLRAIEGRRPDGTVETIPEPLIPLLDTTLLTNSPGEPRVGMQILAEIHSAEQIDVVMAFIRLSGIRPLLDALGAHCAKGGQLRVLTTTYTGSTEPRALDALRDAGAKVLVSYDTNSTRLHAKAWLFHRRSGFSTAYIGSSNLTHSAQISGLEWNVRVSGARNPDVIDKVSAVFETYWHSGDFVSYEPGEFASRLERNPDPGAFTWLSPLEVRLEPFQERLLEQIELSRTLGHHRNLLVSATGTGKTVMAAVDFARLRPALGRSRLLFVAHRTEILEQSMATFRHALRDHTFGELWVGGRRPRLFEHVFASIQSLNATGFRDLDPDRFDVVIVDEFHHAAAQSYQALLEHVRPMELLALTATPERSDGLALLGWFDGRIAAELRLWDAIDRHHLSPFHYYGVHDGMDYREVPWRRGRGYDVSGLSNLFTADDHWARRVLSHLLGRIDDHGKMRALGFCVSVEHARFMARVFQEAGVAATAVWADSPDRERRAALADLAAQRVNVVFSVDLFNEGIDVPVVDTLLFLRPTDSPTLFLQQLGRGLRLSPDKTVCTVLDFVGSHRKEFRFDRRFRALLGGSRKDLIRHIETGFPFLPAGCHMEMDRVAEEIILRNIREAVPYHWTAKVEELRRFARPGVTVGLAPFLEFTELDLEDVYTGTKTWSDLKADAGLELLPPGPRESVLRRAIGRLLHVDDLVRITAYRRFLSSNTGPDCASLSVRDQRLLRMLAVSIADRALGRATTLQEACSLIWEHPQVRAEVLELLEVLEKNVDHVHVSLTVDSNVPLLVHARYSRIEILAAFGVGEFVRVAPWQAGVFRAREAGADLLVFTLDKTTGQFSPTTRYHDYAVSPELIHWESQSGTRADSETGRRYQNHLAMGSSVMLFARLRSDDRAFWFLGSATYESHESECPMAVTWRLHHSLPGDLFASFAAAVA